MSDGFLVISNPPFLLCNNPVVPFYEFHQNFTHGLYITLHYITGTNTTATPQTSRNGPSSVSKAVHQPSQPLAALLNHLANKHQLLSQGKRRKVTYQPMTRGQMVRYGADAYFVDLCRSHRNKFKFKEEAAARNRSNEQKSSSAII